MALSPFHFLTSAPRTLAARALGEETPQDIALALSYLDPAKAASLLEALENDQLGRDVALALGHLTQRDPARAAELAARLQRSLLALQSAADDSFDGGAHLLRMLQEPPTLLFRDDTLAYLARVDPALEQHLRERLVTFRDIEALSDEDLEKLLVRALWGGMGFFIEDLACALRTCDEAFVRRVMRLLPSEQGVEIEDRVFRGSPITASQHQRARAMLLTLARGLFESQVIRRATPATGRDRA